MIIKGMAMWAKLGIPKDNYDEYQGNGKRNYMIDLYVTDEDMKEFKSKITDAYAGIAENPKYQKNGKPQDCPSDPVYSPVRTDKDGKEFLRFITKAFTPEGEQKTFPLFGADKNPLDKQVGNGSTVQVSYVLSGVRNNAKNAGVCGYMNAILVNKLVEFGGTGGSAESFGFDVEKPSDAYGFHGSEEDVPI